MKARLSYVIPVLAGVVATVLLGIVGMHWAEGPPMPSHVSAEVPEQPAEAGLPRSLDCAFHNFTRTAAVVSFYFDVELPSGEAPRFYERAILLADGARQDFAGSDRPAWTYGLDPDGKPQITSPDGATRIVLYGLKLGTAGVLPVEAGIRSNVYRNLGGECRQTNLGGGAH
jgi:hypothetical protein